MKNFPLPLFCALLLGLGESQAVEIKMGSTSLTVPAPDGFEFLDGNTPYAKLSERFVPAANIQYAIFLTKQDAEVAVKGGNPAPDRWFYVQASRALIDRPVTIAEFAEMKQIISTENEKILRQVEREMPDFVAKVNKGIAEDFKVDPRLSVNQMVPLPPHLKQERAMAYSALMSVNANGPDGKPVKTDSAMTIAFAHLKGKILFFYAKGGKEDLEWTREQSKKWVEAVIAANPSVGEVARSEAAPSHGSGFDWSGIWGKVIIGAVAGAIIGGLSTLFRKKG